MDEKIANKIRGLLRQAENTPFEEEADTFLRKAQELMITHSIDEERLWANEPSRRQQIETVVIKIPGNKPGSMQKRIILNQIARLNNCRMWYSGDHASVAGYSGDLLWVEMLHTSILTQMNFKMAIAQAMSEGANARTFRTNFADAYSSRICSRLKKMYAQASQEVTGEAGTDIALRARGEEVEKWVNDRVSLRNTSYQSSARYDSGARDAGRTAADNTDISGGRGRVGAGRKALK